MDDEETGPEGYHLTRALKNRHFEHSLSCSLSLPRSARGFQIAEPQIKKAVDWFVSSQGENGLWKVHLVRGKDKDLNLWIALAICRIIRKL